MRIEIKEGPKGTWLGYIFIDRPVYADIGTFNDVINRIWIAAKKQNIIYS